MDYLLPLMRVYFGVSDGVTSRDQEVLLAPSGPIAIDKVPTDLTKPKNDSTLASLAHQQAWWKALLPVYLRHLWIHIRLLNTMNSHILVLRPPKRLDVGVVVWNHHHPPHSRPTTRRSRRATTRLILVRKVSFPTLLLSGRVQTRPLLPNR